jgi:hypothetical protein
MSKEVHGLTPTQIEDLKAKHGILKVAELFDSEGKSQGFVVLGKPSAAVIGQFEKFIDKDPMKARGILVNGTVLTRTDEFKDMDRNSEVYAAVFDAAAQMIPVGKAVLKNL